jgi:hypothetical protein
VRGKRQRLAASGPRHSTPEKGQDRLCQSYDFFDPADLLQVKSAMLRRVERDGTSVSQAAHAFGFSRRHFYALQRQFAVHGFQGFVPPKRGPKGAYKRTADVGAFIAKARAAPPSWNASALSRRGHEHCGLTGYPRSVARALARPKKARTSCTHQPSTAGHEGSWWPPRHPAERRSSLQGMAPRRGWRGAGWCPRVGWLGADVLRAPRRGTQRLGPWNGTRRCQSVPPLQPNLRWRWCA